MKMMRRVMAIVVGFCLILEQTGFAQVAPQFTVPAYLNGYVAADKFRPVQLRSISLDQAAGDMKLFLDAGDSRDISTRQARESAQKLLEYFRIGLSLPNEAFWVNLRPDAQDKIMDVSLERTDMGKVLLEADLQLKKDLAAFTSPDTREGKQYWNRLYARAEQIFGQDTITIPTVTRPWIVPGEIILRQSQESAYIYKATLKVMLEQDWFTQPDAALGISAAAMADKRMRELNAYSSELIRTHVLPKLTAEVNSSRKYAALRQVYYSLILAQWYKRQFQGKETEYASRINSRDLSGLESKRAWSKNSFFNAYKKSFSEGEYKKQEMIKGEKGLAMRRYFSGGVSVVNTMAAQNSVSNQVFTGTNAALTEPLIAYSTRTDEVTLAQQSASAVEDTKTDENEPAGRLEKGWVIANHILVSFHVAFIVSLLSLPVAEMFSKWDVLQYVFASAETPLSALLWYIGWHSGIALHEMGHYLKAVKTSALRPELLPAAQEKMQQGFLGRLKWYAEMFVKIPWGKFEGVKKVGKGIAANYYADAPFNLSVAAEGPRFSGKVARIALPAGIGLLVAGLFTQTLPAFVGIGDALVFLGRMFFGIGAISFLDYKLADPGKLAEFDERERKAAEKAAAVEGQATQKEGQVAWKDRMPELMRHMINNRIQKGVINGLQVWAPWGWRNSGMGGRHTEKEYPKSNISMQETMFIPLSAKSYEEAQRMTVELQERLKHIIENAEGAIVMGIGLEGGLATYIEKEAGDLVPEQRLWRMAAQAIKECGYIPGVDVALALDPASSELETAYREKFEQPDAVGMYLFWRDSNQVVMSRDEIQDMIAGEIEKGLPVVSVEDVFAEDDYQGWKNWMEKYGKSMFVIGDDLVTTNDKTIEMAADEGWINTVLVKPNQIGSIAETLLAMLVARGKKMHLVVSHRSKSPNDDMEAQFAIAAFTEGLKAGGGANTERLVKYGAIIKMLKESLQQETQLSDADVEDLANQLIPQLRITGVFAYEEATNAGIPTVGVKVNVGVPGTKFNKLLEFTGSTPLGTSAGTNEAIHLVDSIIEPNEQTAQYADLFKKQADGTFIFKKDISDADIAAKNDPALTDLFRQAQRYNGKGTMNAVRNVEDILAKLIVGKSLSEFTNVLDIDRALLQAEFELGVSRGKISADAPYSQRVAFMQRKANLGMNAILSLSLALTRMTAASQGKDMWQLLRESMSGIIARTIAQKEGVSAEELVKTNTYEQLVEKLQAFEEERAQTPGAAPLYETLRAAYPVYGETDGGKRVQDSGSKTEAQEIVNQQAVAVEQQAAAANQAPEELGGVDLRALPVSVRPVDASRLLPPNSALLKMSLQDLDKTWKELRGKVEGQAVPYQQLKEYVAACKSRSDAAKQLAQARRYIGELLKLEEERAVASSSEMREIVGIIG